MGLMPVYYTTTKLSGRRKSSVRERRLREEHEKWIRKNVGETQLKKIEPLKIGANRPEKKYESIGNGIGNGFVKTTSAISGDYIVGQAYNKGNLVVLSKEDAKDESTGKRR
tara:strand:+ start:186 stop:518 length:333 start_codon:yes stop_codon:yes gene_type:complete